MCIRDSSYSEHSDFQWPLRSFNVVLSLVKNISEDVSVTAWCQQMWKIRSSQRIFLDLSSLWESRVSWMSGIEEIYPNNVCTNARFTFWSYFSLDPYEDLLDFVQTKHQVRIDSPTARGIKQKHLRIKRNDKTTGPARAPVVWQRCLISWFDSSCQSNSWKVGEHLHTQGLEISAMRIWPLELIDWFFSSLKFTC